MNQERCSRHPWTQPILTILVKIFANHITVFRFEMLLGVPVNGSLSNFERDLSISDSLLAALRQTIEPLC